eukprot:m.15984 g.15984  ORF g.15984 m.15984 type:complete len:1882 (+) comp6882_c0_seq1:234-5879(+)
MSKKRAKSSTGRKSMVPTDDGVDAQLNDASWKVFPIVVHATLPYSRKYAGEAIAAASQGRRKRFKTITHDWLTSTMADAVKVKGKTKDPELASLYELLMSVSGSVEGATIPPDAVASVVRTLMWQDREKELARRAQLEEQALAASVAADSKTDLTKTPSRAGSRAKTPKGKGKAAAAVDTSAPGKKKLTMKTRAEEAAIIDYINDEPSHGPDQYWVLWGFTDPHVIKALNTVGVHVQAVVEVTTPDDDDFVEYPEPPQQPDGDEDGATMAEEQDPDLLQKRALLQACRQFIPQARTICSQSEFGSPLRDIAWLTLDVGLAPAGAKSFDGLAELIYQNLKHRAWHTEYLGSLQSALVPSATLSPDLRLYGKLLDTVPATNITPEVIVECMVQQVIQTVQDQEQLELELKQRQDTKQSKDTWDQPQTAASASPLSKGAVTASQAADESPIDPAMSAFLERELGKLRLTVPDSPQEPTTMPSTTHKKERIVPIVIRHGDAVVEALSTVEPNPIFNALEAVCNQNLTANIKPLTDLIPDTPMFTDLERQLYRQQLLTFCSLPLKHVERALVMNDFVSMLANSTETQEADWDLSQWCVTENHTPRCFAQLLRHAMRCQPYAIATRYTASQHALLVCLYQPRKGMSHSHRSKWLELAHSTVGFTDFLEHTLGYLGEDQFSDAKLAMEPTKRVGFDVQGRLIKVAGEDEHLFLNDGSVVSLLHSEIVPGEYAAKWVATCGLWKLASHKHFGDQGADAGRSFTLSCDTGDVVYMSRRMTELLKTQGKSEWKAPVAATPETEAEEEAPSSAKSKGKDKDAKGKDRPKSKRGGSSKVKIRDPPTEPSAPPTEELEAAAAAAAAVTEFTPIPTEALLRIDVGTADGMLLCFVPDGTVTMTLKQGTPLARPSPAFGNEVSRTITPNGDVIRSMASGDTIVYSAAGEVTCRFADGRVERVSFDGKRTITTPGNDAEPVEEEVLLVERTSVPESTLVLARADNSIRIGNPDRDFSVEFEDGTRIITQTSTRQVRVECLNFPPLVLEEGVTRVSLVSGVTLIHSASEGKFEVQGRQNEHVTLSSSGQGSAMFGNVNVEHKFDYLNGTYTGTDDVHQVQIADYVATSIPLSELLELASEPSSPVPRMSVQANPSAGAPRPLYSLNTEAKETSLSDKTPPLLFLVQKDGSAVQYLRETDVEAFLEEAKQVRGIIAAKTKRQVQLVEQPLEDDPQTTTRTLIRLVKADNLFYKFYSSASLLPPSLQRTPSPAAAYQPTSEALVVRQLHFHPTLTPEQRGTLDQDLCKHQEWLNDQSQATEQVVVLDPRSQLQSRASLSLQQQVDQVLTHMEDQSIRTTFEKMTAPPPVVVAQRSTKTTLDEFLQHDPKLRGSMKDMKEMLRTNSFTRYWQSPEASLQVLQPPTEALEATTQSMLSVTAALPWGEPGVKRATEMAEKAQSLAASRRAQPQLAGVTTTSSDPVTAVPIAAEDTGRTSKSPSGLPHVSSGSVLLGTHEDDVATVPQASDHTIHHHTSESSVISGPVEDDNDGALRESVSHTKGRFAHNPGRDADNDVAFTEDVGESRDQEAFSLDREPDRRVLGHISPSSLTAAMQALPFMRTDAEESERAGRTSSAQVLSPSPALMKPMVRAGEAQQAAGVTLVNHSQGFEEMAQTLQRTVPRPPSTPSRPQSSSIGTGNPLPEVRVKSAQTLGKALPRELLSSREAKQAAREMVPSTMATKKPLPPLGKPFGGASARALSATLSSGGWSLFPNEAHFGTLKHGSSYSLVIKVRNREDANLRFKLSSIPTSTGIVLQHDVSRIAPGTDGKITLQLHTKSLNVGEDGTCTTSTTLTVTCDDGTSVELPISATVMNETKFVDKRGAALLRGKGVKLIPTQPSA